VHLQHVAVQRRVARGDVSSTRRARRPSPTHAAAAAALPPTGRRAGARRDRDVRGRQRPDRVGRRRRRQGRALPAVESGTDFSRRTVPVEPQQQTTSYVR